MAAACGSSKTAAPATTATTAAATTAAATTAAATTAAATTAAKSALPTGLWDDGPCDAAKPPLKIGLQTVFASGVLTLGDQAKALEAAAKAFNARGGANKHCIQVTTCDDGADPNKALNCVRTLTDAGVVATVNDTTSVAGKDVSAAYAAAGIARFAISPGQDDYPDVNAYPFDGGGTGTSLMMPQALLDKGIKKIAIVRVDIPAATALKGFYQAVFTGKGLEVVADLPVPAGTTDYSQFILAAQAAGAKGVAMPIGGQEGIQVLKAGQQLKADLTYSSSLGTFPLSDIAALGDYSSRVLLNAAIPPAGFDDPVNNVLVADLGASGVKELQKDNMKSSPMRSWVGLYGLLYVLRQAKMDAFTKETVKAAIEASGPIPMLGLTKDFTPKFDHPGAFKRLGNGFYAFWAYDPASKGFKKVSEADMDKLLCGSPVGAKTC